MRSKLPYRARLHAGREGEFRGGAHDTFSRRLRARGRAAKAGAAPRAEPRRCGRLPPRCNGAPTLMVAPTLRNLRRLRVIEQPALRVPSRRRPARLNACSSSLPEGGDSSAAGLGLAALVDRARRTSSHVVPSIVFDQRSRNTAERSVRPLIFVDGADEVPSRVIWSISRAVRLQPESDDGSRHSLQAAPAPRRQLHDGLVLRQRCSSSIVVMAQSTSQSLCGHLGRAAHQLFQEFGPGIEHREPGSPDDLRQPCSGRPPRRTAGRAPEAASR